MKALAVLLLGIACVTSGCATGPQTAAAAATGGLLGLGLGIQAMTGSKLEVTVDMYAPTPEQRDAMRVPRPFALTQSLDDRRRAESDPVVNPTPVGIARAAANLRTVAPAFEASTAALARAAAQVRSAGGAGVQAAATLERQRDLKRAAVEALKAFDTSVTASVDRLQEPDVLAVLALKLSTVRERTDQRRRFEGMTQEYRDLVVAALGGGLVADAGSGAAQVMAVMNNIPDTATADGAERIAAVLDAVRRAAALIPGSRANVDRVLRALDFPESGTLITLGSAGAIVQLLRETPPTATCETSGPQPINATTDANRCQALVYASTFALNKLTGDVSMGLISNEIAQVLQASARALGVVTDPANAGRWRLETSVARADGGPGNHNSLIYLENMGLPIVKSSAFDPTKFIVAAGALYRQVFAASAAALGAPVPGAPAAAGAGTGSGAAAAGTAQVPAINVIATRARVRNAEKATADVREKVIDVLKTTTEAQKRAKAGNWTTQKPALVQDVQVTLRRLADQLEAVAGTK